MTEISVGDALDQAIAGVGALIHVRSRGTASMGKATPEGRGSDEAAARCRAGVFVGWVVSLRSRRACRARGSCYACAMTDAAQKLLAQALALPEADRLTLLAELVASLDGQPEAGSEAAWVEELDARHARAGDSPDAGEEWGTVRSRLVEELRTK